MDKCKAFRICVANPIRANRLKIPFLCRLIFTTPPLVYASTSPLAARRKRHDYGNVLCLLFRHECGRNFMALMDMPNRVFCLGNTRLCFQAFVSEAAAASLFLDAAFFRVPTTDANSRDVILIPSSFSFAIISLRV